jgi:hypothetical protein
MQPPALFQVTCYDDDDEGLQEQRFMRPKQFPAKYSSYITISVLPFS